MNIKKEQLRHVKLILKYPSIAEAPQGPLTHEQFQS